MLDGVGDLLMHIKGVEALYTVKQYIINLIGVYHNFDFYHNIA